MGTANYVYGKPVMSKYTTVASYNAGDVIVLGGTPFVAHADNPPFTGGTLTDALAAGGGFYQMTANTLTYGPDRFAFRGGASSAINWSINADAAVAGFSKSLKFQRKSANADTAALNMVQVVETADSIRMQGQVVTLSFWAKKGAN